MKKFFKNYIEDIFIIMGVIVIVAVTFFISKIIGFYLLGAVLIGTGIVISIISKRSGGDKD